VYSYEGCFYSLFPIPYSLFLLLLTLLPISCNQEVIDSQESENKIYTVIFHEVSPYHLKAPCVSPDYFRDVLEMILVSSKKTVFASEAVAAVKNGNIPESGWVLLTFDDGETGILDYAHPLLQEYGMKGTAFVFTAGIDDGQPRHLSWDDLHSMYDSGIWEIHSHSDYHHNLLKVDEEIIAGELNESFRKLRTHGFIQDLYIAYPHGSQDEFLREMAKKAGYTAGFGAGNGISIAACDDLMQLNRSTIAQIHNQEIVCRKLGLDLEAVQSHIAIYDEAGADFSAGWKAIADEVRPQGFYGTSCRVSETADATCQFKIQIREHGTYHLSLWTPMEQQDLKISAVDLSYTVQQGSQVLTSNNRVCFSGRQNGWERFATVVLPAGETICVLRTSNNDTGFIVDALKAEKVKRPQ
jgi:peptidoglycan/xylan/chitin deacetylase (PgdA/CDA1 family)